MFFQSDSNDLKTLQTISLPLYKHKTPAPLAVYGNREDNEKDDFLNDNITPRLNSDQGAMNFTNKVKGMMDNIIIYEFSLFHIYIYTEWSAWPPPEDLMP